MGIYGPSDYFKDLYPGAFRETSLYEAFIYLLLFAILMLAVYICIRFFEKRSSMVIDDTEQQPGDEIYYGMHGSDLSYRLMIKKMDSTEWTAYKIYRSGRKVSLRKGDLRKIIDYINRNFGYDDRVSGSLH